MHPKAENGPAKIGWFAASGVVIANMIGTGVFTSLGFQLETVQSTWSILLLWVIGGLLALAGAFVYAELGAHFARSGGDYIFLSRTLHPAIGYLYAWTSLTVGFSAPIAIAAMAMVQYLRPVADPAAGSAIGIAAIISISLLHSFSVRHSGIFHLVLTSVKVLFAAGLVAVGLVVPAPPGAALETTDGWQHELLLPGFAVSLIYVSYAYTGWNSAAYITGEIRDAGRNLPKALIGATAFVTILYVLLHVVFLRHATTAELKGQVDVALVSLGDLFSGELLPWLSVLISIQLLSTISGYVWIGPRVTHALAREFHGWRMLSRLNQRGIPVRALWLNSAISVALILSGSFEKVLLYAGFVLQVMGTLTIIGSLRMRARPGEFRSPFRPYLQIAYAIFSLWILGYTFFLKPVESSIGIVVISTGLLLYFFDRRTSGESGPPETRPA